MHAQVYLHVDHVNVSLSCKATLAATTQVVSSSTRSIISFVGDNLNKTMTVQHIDLEANTLLAVQSRVLSTETDAIASVPGFTYMQPLAFFPTPQDTAATRIFVSCIVCHRRKPLSFPR